MSWFILALINQTCNSLGVYGTSRGLGLSSLDYAVPDSIVLEEIREVETYLRMKLISEAPASSGISAVSTGKEDCSLLEEGGHCFFWCSK